ncbi:OmpA family protein [Brumimicrobium oceani]|uniref:OmpA-like domain-containing protein n=1 Tax=Brumimicrobium oceani TaxID=2100725 RepID=A0A2U2XBN4_9FLAO|nr:OmpA family protein [Brumimicrobium oceani]PWH85173.1 hypothetical protein DIT68_11090 [Brumimicrobium oceani]
MDWSKKIGITILSVLILASCSSRKNYGSVYFARGDVFSDSSIYDGTTVGDYMAFSDSINEYVGSVILDDINKGDTDYAQESLGALMDSIVAVDFVSADTLEFDVEIEIDTVITKDVVLSDSNTVLLEETENDSIQNETMRIADSLIANEIIILPDSVVDIPASYDSLNVEKSAVVKDTILNIESTDSSSIIKSDSLTKTISPSIEERDDQIDSTSTKIIYTDTIGIIREKEIQNSNDSKEIEGRTRDNKTPKIIPVIIPTKQKEKADTLKNSKIESTKTIGKSDEIEIIEVDEIESVKSKEDSIQNVLNEAKALEESDRLAKEKSKADSISKSNVLYLKELDSIKKINESLRNESKTKHSAIDTLIYSVFFASGEKELSEANKKVLQELVKDAENKNYALQLSGYADKSGSASFNKILSEQRVKNVLNYLIAQGLDDRKIHFQSFGDKYSPNANDLNRRIVYCSLILINY